MRGPAAAAPCAVAFSLHEVTATSRFVAGGLAIALGVLGWRGRAWRRGALAGTLAGVPPLIAPGWHAGAPGRVVAHRTA